MEMVEIEQRGMMTMNDVGTMARKMLNNTGQMILLYARGMGEYSASASLVRRFLLCSQSFV